ncbi:MAG: hypothetical protein H7138_26690 [Myxococcales bacterium]|nr:hypothetical protein [Myxococcales bacterium]
MPSVAFVFTSPRHHLEMMAPVAAELTKRGVACRMISLAELRGHDTPKGQGLHRVLPFNVRGKPAMGGAPTTVATDEKKSWRRGTLAKSLVWGALALRIRQLIAGADVVVVPNDTAYPYDKLLAQVVRRGARTVLMQEGIRFPPEKSYIGGWYGTGGATRICAWGEGSKEYFTTCQVAEGDIVVTGTPRLDTLDPAAWTERGTQLLAQHGLASAPLVFTSNPIETQGFGTERGKLALFARLLAEAAPVLRAQQVPLCVKNHPQEDPEDYARIARGSAIADLVTVLPASAPIFALLAAARGVIVLTSTVGLEALAFGLPIGVLEIPGFPFAFDYVQRGAAVPLTEGTIGAGVAELLAGAPARRAAGQALIERHLYDRGRARHHVADVIEQVLAMPSRRDPS